MEQIQHPLILVFYLDAELMRQSQIMGPFKDSVELLIQDKNILAFFLPTKGEERLECINPTVVDKADMDKINKMVDDIKKQFDIKTN